MTRPIEPGTKEDEKVGGKIKALSATMRPRPRGHGERPGHPGGSHAPPAGNDRSPGKYITGDTVLGLHPLEYIPSPASAAWLREGRPVDVLIGQRMTYQIPDPGARVLRYDGACANRLRASFRNDEGDVAVRAAPSGVAPASRGSRARLLHQVFEVDPLT